MGAIVKLTRPRFVERYCVFAARFVFFDGEDISAAKLNSRKGRAGMSTANAGWGLRLLRRWPGVAWFLVHRSRKM
jgi:hypothetical protein